MSYSNYSSETQVNIFVKIKNKFFKSMARSFPLNGLGEFISDYADIM